MLCEPNLLKIHKFFSHIDLIIIDIVINKFRLYIFRCSRKWKTCSCQVGTGGLCKSNPIQYKCSNCGIICHKRREIAWQQQILSFGCKILWHRGGGTGSRCLTNTNAKSFSTFGASTSKKKFTKIQYSWVSEWVICNIDSKSFAVYFSSLILNK